MHFRGYLKKTFDTETVKHAFQNGTIRANFYSHNNSQVYRHLDPSYMYASSYVRSYALHVVISTIAVQNFYRNLLTTMSTTHVGSYHRKVSDAPATGSVPI
jgi:hypothetical protein